MSIKKWLIPSLPDFTKDCPRAIKDIAVKDACLAVKAAKKAKKKNGEPGKAKFRSRKNAKQTIFIRNDAIKERGIYVRLLGHMEYGESLPDNWKDSRLVRQYGRYYLQVSFEEATTKADNQGRVVALDPGVRNFMTFFSETSFGWLGKDISKHLLQLGLRLDQVHSEMSKSNAKRRYRLKKVSQRIRRKITNKINELHWKIARFLVDSFDVIFLPTFETSEMVIKDERVFNSKVARSMMTLKHYQFKLRLKQKAIETGKMVLDVNEAYTSKTVSWNGEIISNLNGSKTISSDSLTMDRDLNAARNIFIKTVVDTPLQKFVNVC